MVTSLHVFAGMASEQCRALIVEDDPSVASLFTAIRGREGCTVESVGSGNEAIRCVADDRYHLLVIDLMLPATNGQAVIDFLRTHRLEALATVIVVSANVAAIRGGYPEPICRFLAKPFDVTEFVRFVHACKALCNQPSQPSGADR